MGIKILVIDDDPDTRDVLEHILTEEGYEVIRAADGKQGVNLAQKIKPNLIMCDIKMPGLDGFEVENLLKTSGETVKIPIIMITGTGDLDAIQKSFSRGAISYLIKPFDFEEVKKKVKFVLQITGQLTK